MRYLGLFWGVVAGCAAPAGTHWDAGPGGPSGGGLDGGAHDAAKPPPAFDLLSADLSGPADMLPGILPGFPCTQDSDCTSDLCKDVLVGSGMKYCVAPCTKQSDCDVFMHNLFCEATTPGASSGWCIPRSPMHCSSCTADSDCGNLSERCLTAPNDIAPACHIDCALGGAGACPTDYDCTTVNDGGTSRQLCLPKTKVCLDSLGGFCDRVTLPQPCERDNAAGSCVGQRVCLGGGSVRYDKCNAMAPMLKMSCTDLDPAGCMEQFSPTAISTPQNCGACGNTCPGTGQTTGDALCSNPSTKTCDFTCKGDNYDVNNNASDGCEVADLTNVHDQSIASYVGSFPCNDGSSQFHLTGRLPSDKRVHNPAPTNFSSTMGAAPDWYQLFASGGAFCVDDYVLNLQMSFGGSTANCYQVSMITNKGTYTVSTSGSGSNSASGGSGSYSDGTNIFFVVQKICSTASEVDVNPQYDVTGHL
jgi:hypothetical protein